MQTSIHKDLLGLASVDSAESILRSCVHCGFCTAACPTYQLTGDELDGPRGRIYLIKQLLEDNYITAKAVEHLDRCLTCRACEEACPSGVEYGRLLETGREIAETRVTRPLLTTIYRWLIRKVVPYPRRFALLLKLGRTFSFLLPESLASLVPEPQTLIQPRQTDPARQAARTRKVLVFDGCVESVVTPNTSRSLIELLDKFGITGTVIKGTHCCGALAHHLGAASGSRRHMRKLIDSCWPFLEQGIEAILVPASGCGVHLKEMSNFFADDAEYREKARRIERLFKDPSEVLGAIVRDASVSSGAASVQRVVFQSPCTLQHGQKIKGLVESILSAAGVEVIEYPDSHICCGSAGTYSLLQPEMSKQLLHNKIKTLASVRPDLIVTANIGCQMHIGSATDIPVIHWVELLNRLCT